ncbi:hypothetical protein, partial [Klebsiella pneumoniae]|uniref:hypothetical protein n=1 Tax=Klebsiella pneumoniae TaxID=573 RepID=UPI0013A584AC
MADVGRLAQQYNQVVGSYQWLKYHTELVEDAYIEQGVKKRIHMANSKEELSYKESQLLKSGRDVVSGYTWYDIRKRVSS